MIYDSIEQLVNDFPGRTSKALVFEDKELPGKRGTLSYPEFASLIHSLAQSVKESGNMVDFVRTNHSPEVLIRIFADIMAGVTVVLLDPMLPPLREQAIRRLLGPQLENLYGRQGAEADELAEQPDGNAQTVLYGENAQAALSGANAQAALSGENAQAVPSGGNAQAVLSGENAQAVLSGETEKGREGHLVFFTSGTTASSKAVVLPVRALLHASWRGQKCLPIGEGDTLLSILPLSHVFGFVCTMLWGLCYGATVALGRGVRHLMDDPKFFRPTVLPLVPTLASAMTRFSCYDPELKTILIGAAPLGEAELEAMKKKTKAAIYTGYGLTETASGVAITQDPEDPYSLRVCPGVELKLGKDSEILLKTDSLLERYIELLPGHASARQDEESLLDEDGFFHTGDIGFFDNKGRIHISGRKKDIIVLPDGTKVFCPEYEKALAETLGTDELAVAGQKGRAILLVSDKVTKETAESAVSKLNQKLARSQQIAGIIYLNVPLPRTVTGKLKRWMIEKAIMKGDFEGWKQ